MIDSGTLISFYKYQDCSTVQVDLSDSEYWIVDPDRKYINAEDFQPPNNYFDYEIKTDITITDRISMQNLLHIYNSETKNGPELTIPIDLLKSSSEFTVELWVEFEEFTIGNFSIIGITGRPWDQGFSLGGVMNYDSATVTCVMDVYLTSSMKSPCYAASSFCYNLEVPRNWHHFSCSRFGTSIGEMTKDKEFINLNTQGIFTHDIGDLFSPGNFGLGTKYDGESKMGIFNGYIRELRLWSKMLDSFILSSLSIV